MSAEVQTISDELGYGRTSDERAIASAAKLFLRDGIEGVKMVDIARDSNVGVATLYRHFSTKAQLAVAAATLLWEHFNTQVRELVESGPFLKLDGLGRLSTLFHTYCDAYEKHGDFVAFLDEFDRLVLRGHVSTQGMKEYAEQLDSFYPVFADSYDLGVQDGSVCPGIDFRTFYLALSHALISMAHKLRRGEVLESDDFSSGVAELRMIVDMAVRALAASTSESDERR